MNGLKWMRPISKNVAHLIPDVKDTGVLVESLCGLKVNPGFAAYTNGGSRCFKCRTKISGAAERNEL